VFDVQLFEPRVMRAMVQLAIDARA
jgi:hypothetical protein